MPFAGNTHELQNGKSAARDWFIRAAAKLKPDVLGGTTAQGFYILSSDGEALAYNNNRNVERVLGIMDKGLAAFKHLPNVETSDAEIELPTGRRPAEDTSILRIFSRVRPIPEGCDPSNENVGRDHYWILATEIRTLLQTGNLPDSAVTRLYRFAMVDNVRGEPDHWKPGEVRLAILDTKKVIEIDGRVTYEVSGRFEMSTPDLSRGMTGSLRGRLSVDIGVAKVSECRIFVSGTAWGRSTYTPNPPSGKFPMVFAIVDAKDETAKVVSPQAIFYGREYLEPKR